MSFEKKDNTGALFQAKKKGEKSPDYSGECLINGIPMQIAGWRNTSSKGMVYLSLKFQAAQDKAEKKSEKAVEDIDDQIPF